MKVEVQKIANLETRLKNWEMQKREWFKGLPFILVTGLVVCGMGVWLLNHFDLITQTITEAVITTIFIAGLLSVLPLKINYPEMPTQSDVEADVALRKAFSMDSEVEKSSSSK